MKEAFFITPDDEVIKLNIYEVNNFCKEICLNEENREAFLEFEKGYTRFEAYFDFVVFELHYLYSFDKRWFAPSSDNTSLYEVYHIDNRRFVSSDNGFKLEGIYDYTINKIKEKEKENEGRIIPPKIVKCSDEELQIEKVDKADIGEELWDLDGFKYKNKTAIPSHQIMALTILNQLLMKENDLYLDVEEFIEYDAKEYYPNYDERDRLLLVYLMQRMGFIRVASSQVVYCRSYENLEEIDVLLKNDDLHLEKHRDRSVLMTSFHKYKAQLFKSSEEQPAIKRLDSK